VKPYPLVLFFLLLLAAGAFAASAQPAQLYAFACFGITQFQNCPSGGRPDNVIQASDGDFYGVSEVTQEGESNPQGGSVFKVTPSGQFTLLHTFPAGTNNNYPSGNLPRLSGGRLRRQFVWHYAIRWEPQRRSAVPYQQDGHGL